jgi:hypothetical protein
MCVLILVLVWRAIRTPSAAARLLGLGATPQPLFHAIIAAGAVTATIASYVGVNYAKFHTLGSMPLRYYQLYIQAPARMYATESRQIHPENIPTSLATYLGPHGFGSQPTFPWVHLVSTATVVGSPKIDVVEPFSTIPASMPALTLLASIGCVLLVRGTNESVRRARLPAIAMVAGGGVVLMTVGITERYLHDFYPALIIFAAAGLSDIRQSLSAHSARAMVALLVALTFISIWLNCSFALLNQRASPWGVPAEKRDEFVQWQQKVDHFFKRIE